MSLWQTLLFYFYCHLTLTPNPTPAGHTPNTDHVPQADHVANADLPVPALEGKMQSNREVDLVKIDLVNS